MSFLASVFSDVCYLHDFEDIKALRGENLVVIEHTLQELLSKENHLFYAPAISCEKAESLLQSIEYALQRIPIEQHNIFV